MSYRGKSGRKRVPLADGLFLGVHADGTVVNGTTNGPKLYVHAGTAAKWAGDGGTVYRVRLTGYGVVIERVSGPAQRIGDQ